MPENDPDTDIRCPDNDRATLRARIEAGLAVRRQLQEDGTPPFWPEELLARVRLRPPPDILDF